MKHFSDQAAKGYEEFLGREISFQTGSLLHGVKGSSIDQSSYHSRGLNTHDYTH